MTQILELADKDFKINAIVMVKKLEGKIKIINENGEFLYKNGILKN